MRVNILLLLLLMTFLVPVQAYAQQEKLANVNLYRDFGGTTDLLFLKGLGAKIDQARYYRNVKSLCACAALLFFAERIVGKKHPQVDGMSLLREATLTAWTEKDIPSLRAVAGVWRSKVFGPGDLSGAEEIEKYIWQLNEARKRQPAHTNFTTTPHRTNSRTTPKPSAIQARLMAEESARVDALQQVAERIYGVMIQSLSSVKDFNLSRDVVIATLKPSLLLGAQFSQPVDRGDEIHVSVTLSRSFIIKAIKQFYRKRGKRMDWMEQDRLERELDKQYRAVGIGYINK